MYIGNYTSPINSWSYIWAENHALNNLKLSFAIEFFCIQECVHRSNIKLSHITNSLLRVVLFSLINDGTEMDQDVDLEHSWFVQVQQ